MGFDLTTFTIFHTIISLLALVAGIPVTIGLFSGRIFRLWTRAFLALAIATSVTGFMFPFHGVTPAIVVGVVALLILAAVLAAAYRFRLAGKARWIYAAGMVASLYLLVFVAIAQSFQKIPVLQPLAPTGSEPPFAIAQGIVLLAFIAIGIGAARKFRPAVI